MCVSPLHIKNPKLQPSLYDPVYIDVPCGKCIECQQAKQMEWTHRALAHIKKYHDLNYDVFYYTLTYNDDFLPVCLCWYDENDKSKTIEKPCFSKKDVQKFLCRLRTRLSRDFGLTFTYIISSEYGHRNNRPHYHALFFIDGRISPYEFKAVVSSCWSSKETFSHRRCGSVYGFDNFVRSVSFGFVKAGAHCGLVERGKEFPVNYVCKYIAKDFDVNSDYIDYLQMHVLQFEDAKFDIFPFHLQSSGFGLYMIQDHDNFDFDSLTYKLVDCSKKDDDPNKFKLVPLPRYCLLHLLYNKYINENGNVSYSLNDLGISIKLAQIEDKVEKFKQKIFDFDKYPLSFFSVHPALYQYLSMVRQWFPNYSSFFENCSGSIDWFAEYCLVYRGRSRFGLSKYYKSDYERFLKSDFLPFYFDEWRYYVEYSESLECLRSLFADMCCCIRYHSYKKNVEKYNIEQRLRSKTSSDLKLVDEVDFNTYFNNKFQKVHEYIDFELGFCAEADTAASAITSVRD